MVCGQNGNLAGVVLINATDRLEACRELVRERPAMDEAYETLDEAETELGNVTSQTHA